MKKAFALLILCVVLVAVNMVIALTSGRPAFGIAGAVFDTLIAVYVWSAIREAREG